MDLSKLDPSILQRPLPTLNNEEIPGPLQVNHRGFLSRFLQVKPFNYVKAVSLISPNFENQVKLGIDIRKIHDFQINEEFITLEVS